MAKKLVEGVDYITHYPRSEKQEMILSNDAQILVIGGAMGSGKTYMQQLLGLRYIDDPNTAIVTFRRTMDEIKGQGGVWDTAEDIYSVIHPSVRPTPTRSALTFKFPSGATSVYKGMELVKDSRKNQGLQFTLCNFDEGTLFEWEQIEYLFQRMRSSSKYQSRIVISTNPDPDHKIAELIDWYLDEEGYPDENKQGVLRYFIRKNGEFEWGDTREEVGKRFDIPEDKWESSILSFSFIGATIYDNPVLRAANPEYEAFLEGMNDVDKARNLHGNWYARAEGAQLWKREWLRGDKGSKVKRIIDIPDGCKRIRAWDKGYTEKTATNPAADYTAGSPQILKCPDGFYYLLGNYKENVLDREELDKIPKDRILGRFRELAGARDNLILAQAHHDGEDCTTVLTKDSGAGMTDHMYTLTKLVENGIKVEEDKSSKNTPDKKLKDFQPFCNACSTGVVYIVEETFNKATLEAWYKELENFDPAKKSNSSRKDDWVDSTSSAFNASAQSKIIKTPVYRSLSNYKTLASSLLTSRRL